MKVEVAVLGSPSQINSPYGLCGRQASSHCGLRGRQANSTHGLCGRKAMLN